MKIIGVEIRCGVRAQGQSAIYEAKVIPLELVYPPALSTYPAEPIVTGTIHTTLGDVSFEVRLPMEPGDQWANRDQVAAAMPELKKRVEALA